VLVDLLWSEVQNCLFHQNAGQTGDPRVALTSGDPARVHSAFNFLGQGSLDPRFVSCDGLRQRLGSPCVDQGNPPAPFNDADGTRNDQGAYGGANAPPWRGGGWADAPIGGRPAARQSSCGLACQWHFVSPKPGG
jgi:hypothetical protein